MTEEWTPVTIEARLRAIANENARLISAAQDLHRAYLDAQRTYDLAYARSYVSANGPAHEKRYLADIGTEAQREAKDVADAAYRHVERMLRGKRDELDALRSVGVSVRQAYSQGGSDG